jgi:hypothetical protein
MFHFQRIRPQLRYPTIRQALVQAGLSDAGDPSLLSVVEKHGQYAGRRVNFFRAFKPGQQDRLLGSGHVEREGLVVLNSRPQPEGPPPIRQPADRTTHANYEHLIFWDPHAAQSSAAALSEPADTRLHARSTSHTAEQYQQ